MKLQEARDAFAKGVSTFERAQIVRLDARWIAMLRYHLGNIFEDVYIPASGETDAQWGNTL
jgi:ABC-type ATPase involved in cell division